MIERRPELLIVTDDRKCFFADTEDWHYEGEQLCFVAKPRGNWPSRSFSLIGSYYLYELDKTMPWEGIEK